VKKRDTSLPLSAILAMLSAVAEFLLRVFFIEFQLLRDGLPPSYDFAQDRLFASEMWVQPQPTPAFSFPKNLSKIACQAPPPSKIPITPTPSTTSLRKIVGIVVPLQRVSLKYGGTMEWEMGGIITVARICGPLTPSPHNRLNPNHLQLSSSRRGLYPGHAHNKPLTAKSLPRRTLPWEPT
jgi:hypothetical protein